MEIATQAQLYHHLARPCRGDVIERWGCPVCDRPVEFVYRPGRPRLYCSNACRQKAYRWRRRNHARTTITPTKPAERSYIRGAGRRHALRNKRDFVALLTDARHREVTVCGLLARPARGGPFTHFDYVPDHSWSCLTCTDLITPVPIGPPPDST